MIGGQSSVGSQFVQQFQRHLQFFVKKRSRETIPITGFRELLESR